MPAAPSTSSSRHKPAKAVLWLPCNRGSTPTFSRPPQAGFPPPPRALGSRHDAAGSWDPAQWLWSQHCVMQQLFSSAVVSLRVVAWQRRRSTAHPCGPVPGQAPGRQDSEQDDARRDDSAPSGMRARGCGTPSPLQPFCTSPARAQAASHLHCFWGAMGIPAAPVLPCPPAQWGGRRAEPPWCLQQWGHLVGSSPCFRACWGHLLTSAAVSYPSSRHLVCQTHMVVWGAEWSPEHQLRVGGHSAALPGDPAEHPPEHLLASLAPTRCSSAAD